MIRFFEIIGGEDDGNTRKLRVPIMDENIKSVTSGNEVYRVKEIKGETAVLELEVEK